MHYGHGVYPPLKILLISPNTLSVPYPVYPIGLDYVAGAVSDRHQVQIADMNIVNRDELDLILQGFSPEIIGLSCRNIDNTEAGDPLYFIKEYQELVTWLRRRSEAIIVCGGSGFTIMPEKVFAALQVDYGIIGEGERFRLLVDALEKGEDGKNLPGVLAAEVHETIPPPWNGSLRREFGSSFPHYRFYLDKGSMLNLQTKRGCSFRCIYCPYPHIEGGKHRLSEPDEVARTALRLQEAGAQYFFITDSAFNSDINHSLEVGKAFRRIGITIPWGGFFAPVRLPGDYFTIMKDAGLKHVEFGTESLADRMLQSYRKPFRAADVFAAHRQARGAGLHVAHYMLMGGPGESTSTIKESLENIEYLDKAALFFFIGIRIYPRTPLFDIALAEGKITRETNMLKPVYYEADDIDRETIEALVTQHADKRINWIIGSGGADSASIVDKLHNRGFTGPLWEYLIR